MVMEEAVTLEDVVAEVMVVTKTAVVMGKLELLQRNMVGATGRQVIGPIVMLSLSKAETSDAVITGNLSVCDFMDSVLFDPGSTFSYVSSSFANGLNLHCDLLDILIRVSTLVGESVIVERIYRSCLVTFVESNTYVDLVILEMVDFDVILGMTWLSLNFAILDCNAKTMTLAKPGTDPLV